MAVTLITGQPGGGKTALVVSMLMDIKDRPIFVMGIPELKLDHVVCPPVSEWTEYRQSPEDPSISLPYFTFPPNSIVVLDEAQRVYRPRGVGSKVPPEVAAFETHRHTGVDFILLTQHPNLLDSNIRKLIGRHIHIRVTALGRYRYEWPELGDPESKNSRDMAARERYSPPKRAFSLYKSSELHTVTKVKKPWYMYMFGVAAIVACALGYQVYSRVSAKLVPAQVASSGGQSSSGQITQGQAKNPVLTPAQYVEQYTPRVDGKPWSAAAYDKLTTPTEAPYPAGCIQSKTSCSCYTQQATKYVVSEERCKELVNGGQFMDWQPASRQKLEEQERQAQQSPRVQQQQGAEPPVAAVSAKG